MYEQWRCDGVGIWVNKMVWCGMTLVTHMCDDGIGDPWDYKNRNKIFSREFFSPFHLDISSSHREDFLSLFLWSDQTDMAGMRKGKWEMVLLFIIILLCRPPKVYVCALVLCYNVVKSWFHTLSPSKLFRWIDIKERKWDTVCFYIL